MKIIDLLNKIANGEEIPKKIKYDNLVYEYNEQYDYKNELQINYYSVDNETDFFNNVFCYSLNDKIEILEEEKKIPEKSNIDFNTKLPVSGCSENEAFMMTCISHLGKTIDSLIDYLKSKGDE